MNALDTNVLVYAHDARDPRKEAGITQLYSEDLEAHDGWDGLEIINPFRLV